MRRPEARLRGLKGAAAGAAALFAATASVLASAAPALASSGYGQLIVNPGTSAPGQSVSILGTCPNNGSPLTGVYSAAFAGGQASITKTSINFSGTATIAYGVSAGKYQVSAKCGAGSPTVVITVSGSGGTTASQPAMAPSTWAASSPSMGRSMNPAPASSAAMGMGGAMAPTPSAKPTGMPSAMAGAAMPSASVMATNPPVTSTGIVRVGLAGSGRSTMISTPVAAAAAAAIAATGTVSFVMIRRRRGTSGTHSSHS